MKKNRFKISVVLCGLILLILTAACKKAEKYYQKLDAQPEVKNIYQTVYGVGDTLTLDGRLNPANNLEINIGGISAIIASQTIVQQTLDRVKIVITEEMGIGPDRPISITSAGNTIECRPIEIIESSQMGQLNGQVQWQRVTNLSSGSTPIFCQNGKGTVFFWTPAKSVTRITKTGTITQVFNGVMLSDGHDRFDIVNITASGVDPSERYLYFAAITTDGHADNQQNTIYRFCKVDLQNSQLITINRSALPKLDNQRTLASIQPFEGIISKIKLFEVTGIYPDSKGDVFVQLSQHAVAKLSAAGAFNYRINYNNSYTNYLSRIWDEKTESYVDDQTMVGLLPGTKARNWLFVRFAISPDEGLLYGKLSGSTVGVTLYDLNTQSELYSNNFSFWNPITSTQTPYISGSFGILTLPVQSANIALPGKKLLNFYHGDGDPIRGFPLMGLLDFNNKKGQRYAPGTVVQGGLRLEAGTDQWLNYDEEGMIYSTANSKTVIIKTIYR